MEYISSTRMKVIDSNCEYLGLTSLQLMENAGASVAREIKSLFTGGKVTFIAGKGNNGGDAFVAARHLAYYDSFDVHVLLIGKKHSIKTDEAIKNFELLKYCNIKVSEIFDSSSVEFRESIKDTDIIVDGILGTGIQGDIKQPESSLIDTINSSEKFIISIDSPSGLNVDETHVKKAIIANKTFTFHKLKKSYKDPSVKKFTGDIKVINLGICTDAEKYVGKGNFKSLSLPRKDNHKGDAGKILIVGGGDYFGAPSLAALGALRTGADIVTIALPKKIKNIVATYSPNFIIKDLRGDFLTLDDVPLIVELMSHHDVIIIGNGLGKSEEIIESVYRIILQSKKAVIDADGIDSLKEKVLPKSDIIITPHANEFYRLSGKQVSKDVAYNCDIVSKFSKDNDLTTLLKGPTDIISDGNQLFLNRTGNQGMTVGGTGDVLAGIVGSLFAKNSAIDASSCGAFICGSAGDLAFKEKKYGLLATDIIENIPNVLKSMD